MFCALICHIVIRMQPSFDEGCITLCMCGADVRDFTQAAGKLSPRGSHWRSPCSHIMLDGFHHYEEAWKYSQRCYRTDSLETLRIWKWTGHNHRCIIRLGLCWSYPSNIRHLPTSQSQFYNTCLEIVSSQCSLHRQNKCVSSTEPLKALGYSTHTMAVVPGTNKHRPNMSISTRKFLCLHVTSATKTKIEITFPEGLIHVICSWFWY